MSTSFYEPTDRKANGAYFTPDAVVRSLVSWAVREETDLMLDPSCGDGRFLAGHVNAVGVEQDPASASVARERAPGALVHEGDFFRWATNAELRFDCAAGNPPFILFSGETRAAALSLCNRLGASFSGLASSWAPFLVAASCLIKPGGRMAFVVPAEIGHAPYAAPLLEWLAGQFAHVQIVAVRSKLFPELSEDLGEIASVGIGYVSGANSFFHLRPSEAKAWAIPGTVLLPSIRNARSLPQAILTDADLQRMQREDAPMFLLRLCKGAKVPAPVRRYLESAAGQEARTGLQVPNAHTLACCARCADSGLFPRLYVRP